MAEYRSLYSACFKGMDQLDTDRRVTEQITQKYYIKNKILKNFKSRSYLFTHLPLFQTQGYRWNSAFKDNTLETHHSSKYKYIPTRETNKKPLIKNKIVLKKSAIIYTYLTRNIIFLFASLLFNKDIIGRLANYFLSRTRTLFF